MTDRGMISFLAGVAISDQIAQRNWPAAAALIIVTAIYIIWPIIERMKAK